MSTQQPLPPAGLMRRLGALFYDSLIILAIEMMAAGVVIAVLHALMAMNLINIAPYVDVSDLLTNHPVWSHCTPSIWQPCGFTSLSFSGRVPGKHWACAHGKSKCVIYKAVESQSHKHLFA